MRKCSMCGAKSKVIDSRETETTVQRRRRCVSCGRDWYTFEVQNTFVQTKVDKIAKAVSALAAEVVVLQERASSLAAEVREKIPEPLTPYEQAEPLRRELARRSQESVERNRPSWTKP